jgi:hypothetical protein
VFSGQLKETASAVLPGRQSRAFSSSRQPVPFKLVNGQTPRLSVVTNLLPRTAGDSSLQPQQRTTDLVADGGAALLVVVSDGPRCNCGVMMAARGPVEQTASRACRGGSASRYHTTPGAEQTTDAVVRTCGGGGWAAGEWMHFG